MTETSSLPHTMSEVVAALTRTLSAQTSPGDLAALRRMRRDDYGCPAFWKMAADQLHAELSLQEPLRSVREVQWADIVVAMAELVGFHDPRRSLGRALAEAGYSDLRLLQLLRSHGEVLADGVRTMAHYLRSKAEACNQTEIASLVLSDGRRDAERVRRRIARDYYSRSAAR